VQLTWSSGTIIVYRGGNVIIIIKIIHDIVKCGHGFSYATKKNTSEAWFVDSIE